MSARRQAPGRQRCRPRHRHPPLHPHAARWIADEIWHPKQRQRLLPDGTLELSVPYTNPRELLMDVQRHGADAEVIAPPALREQMREMLSGALGRYG